MPDKTSPQDVLHFGAHHLDLARQRLWRGTTAVELRPKAWAALVQLVQRPGELVSSEELLDLLWPAADVTPKTLTNLVGELRRALGDDLHAPRIIQTVHRRGYRLTAPVRRGPAAGVDHGPAEAAAAVPRAASPGHGGGHPPPALQLARPLVGRARELALMSQLLDQACNGQRRVLLLSGDPGVGKTALIDAFVAQLANEGVMLGRGQSVEQAGEREAFGPMLGLLGQLAAGPMGAQALHQLRRCAPSWLLQMPWLLGEAGAQETQHLRRSLAGAGPGRMVRECCALAEALAQQTPLVLVLEDLHWADAATVDLLVALAQSPAAARLLVLASYQPAEAAVRSHPLVAAMRRLQAQGQAQKMDVPALQTDAVHELLQQRFNNPELSRQLAPLAMQHSGGNPLFLTAALDHLEERGWVQPEGGDSGAEAPAGGGALPRRWQLAVDLHRLHLDLPEHLRQMVAARFEGLGASTLQMLQAASAIGVEFNLQLLQAASGQDALVLEAACHELARKQMFLRARPPSMWPDGSTGSAYAFVHDVYRRVLYESLPLPVRQQAHRRAAERLERGYGPRAAEVAGALASAYSRAAQPEATARVLEMAAVVSYQRFAAVEAAAALEASLEQLALLPDSGERTRTETRLFLTLGPVMLAAHGMAHPRALQAYEAAQTLARRTGAQRELLRGLLGASLVHTMVGRPETARSLAREYVPLAEAHQPPLAAVSHAYAGLAELATGRLATAHAHMQRSLQCVPEPGIPMFMDLHAIAHTQLGRTLCHLGRLHEGLAQLAQAVARCRASGATNDLVQALYWTADTQRVLGLNDAAAANFDEVLPLAEQHGMVTFVTPARIGRLVVTPGGVDPAALLQLIGQYRASGDRWADVGYSVLLADAYGAQGTSQAVAAGLAALEAGFAAVETGALFQPELHRAQAALQARAGARPGVVEASLMQAVTVARDRQAHWLALRSSVALCRHLAAQGEGERGHQLLAAALAAVDGPPECPDLQAARGS